MEPTDDLKESSFHGEKTRMENGLKREWKGGIGDHEKRSVLFCRFVVKRRRELGEKLKRNGVKRVSVFVFCFVF